MTIPVKDAEGRQIGTAEVHEDLQGLVADIRLAAGKARTELRGPKTPQPDAAKRRRQAAKAARRVNR